MANIINGINCDSSGGGSLTDLVGTPSSNTTDLGTISQGVSYQSNNPWANFGCNSGTLTGSVSKGYMQFYANKPITVKAIAFKTPTEGTGGLNCPKTMKLLTSNDGATWTLLQSWTNTNDGYPKAIAIDSPVSARGFRIAWSDMYGASGYDAVGISNIVLLGNA
jgi:hypothetical protein